jgi:hypothetical protein
MLARWQANDDADTRWQWQWRICSYGHYYILEARGSGTD